MTGIDWGAFMLGLAAGAAVSALFFAGLAFGMGIALRATRPTTILLLSASLRIALLLALGWFVAQAGGWAFFGYAVSFLLVRHFAIVFSRTRRARGNIGWN